MVYFAEDHLRFVFKYIDPNNPEAPFSFTVKVDENTGIYNSEYTNCIL